MKIFLLAALVGLNCFVSNTSFAQARADTSDLLQTSVNNAQAIFNKAIGHQSPLYNGPKYFFYSPQQLRGSAYYQEEANATGNVYYDGQQYTNIPLLYDVYKDELATLLFDKSAYFTLLKDGVQSFDLLNHHFININADTLSNNTLIQSGYYDELYQGRSQVLCSTTKIIKVTTSSTGIAENFSEFTKASQVFFLRKNNVYYKITSEGSLLDVLKDKKKLLQGYIKTNRIKFRKDPGQAMAIITAYYDHLSN